MNLLRGTTIRASFLLGLLLAGSSVGQVAKSPGFKVGDGRLHPFIELDGRFDSLVGFFDRDAAGSPVASSELIFHARPGIKFDLETPSTLIGFNGSGEYLWYTGILSPGSVNLSRFQANVALDARFNRDGAVEVVVNDSLIRSDRTQNPVLGVGAISLFNNLSLAFPIHPGGRALEVTPKVAWSVEFFEALLPGFVPACTSGQQFCDPALIQQSNYSNVNFGLGGRWKFLPKTAIIADVNVDWRTYFQGGGTTNPLATIFRSQLGIAGLISPRIAVTLLAGYSGDLANNAIHTVIGTAEFAYTVSENSRVAIGYNRNTAAVPLIGTMIDDRAYIRGSLSVFGGRLLLNSQVSADYFTFLGVPTTPGVFRPVRNDFLVSLVVGPTIVVTSWFDVGANYLLTFRSSSLNLPSLNFPRHEAMLRLSFHY
jgi:hypothetical protein